MGNVGEITPNGPRIREIRFNYHEPYKLGIRPLQYLEMAIA